MRTYLKAFFLPTVYREMDYAKSAYGTHDRPGYPFQMFSVRELTEVYFSPITLFYGGNGSGKSTLLNLIAEKVGIRHESVIHYPEPFYRFCRDLCSFSLGEDEYGIVLRDLPEGSRMVTSDDIFSRILGTREESIRIDSAREAEDEKRRALLDPNRRPVFRDLARDGEDLSRVLEARRKSKSEYLRDHAGVSPDQFSNGETALRLFDSAFQPGRLYLLDEPENSLSAEYQEKLAALILHCARYEGCQFVISSHSPFLLSIENAKVYDLDSYPVSVRRWTELENMKRLAALFSEHSDEFSTK